MPSPPKPWESRSSSSNLSRSSSISNNRTNSASAPANNPTASLPENSSTPSDNMSRPYMSSSYGTGYNSGYGTGYGSSYGTSSGYGYGANTGYGYSSGLGGYSGMGLGSYGGMMGGGYGTGYGTGYGGYNRMGPPSLYGGGMGPGIPGEPSLAAQMAQSTQSTFQILERVVGTFGGVAQMLESTYFATQSSFMAMVGVAEQFGMLKNTFTQMFSFFTIYKYVRNFMYRMLGRRPPVDLKEINAKEFQHLADKPKYSLRPFLMFLSLVFGIPYLLHLFMRSVARRLAQQQQNITDKQLVDGSNATQKFEFAQALYNFVGQNPAELSFGKGDLIAILSRGPEPSNGPPVPQWWQGRLRDGRVGMFPSNYVEILEKKVELPESKLEISE